MSLGFQYRKFSPALALRPYVEHIWVLRANNGTEKRREILAPNGRPSLLFSLGRPGIRIDPLIGRQTSNANIYFSVATRPFVIEQQGEACYVGIELEPYGLAAFKRGQCLPNSSGPLEELFGKASLGHLLNALRAETFPFSVVQHIATFLAERITPLSPHDLTRLMTSIDTIERQDGMLKVIELAHEVNISPSTLRRLFSTYVGTSPEQFVSIIRYASFVRGLIRSEEESSHLLAAMHGYYDEAHAAKNFKKYTGLSKREFLNIYDGIARIMYEK